jgi:hypothetical protein
MRAGSDRCLIVNQMISGAAVRKAQRGVASSVGYISAGLQSNVPSSFLARFEAQGFSFRFFICTWVIPRQETLVPNLHNHISVRRQQNTVFRVNEASS